LEKLVAGAALPEVGRAVEALPLFDDSKSFFCSFISSNSF